MGLPAMPMSPPWGEGGTVTAVAAGTATISASAEGADPVTCTVTVKEAPKKNLCCAPSIVARELPRRSLQ